MKKIVLFLFVLLAVSCTENIRTNCKVSELTETEQLVLTQTDSSAYMSAIILDDKVLVFNDPAKDIIKVNAYDFGVIFIVSFMVGAILSMILCLILER